MGTKPKTYFNPRRRLNQLDIWHLLWVCNLLMGNLSPEDLGPGEENRAPDEAFPVLPFLEELDVFRGALAFDDYWVGRIREISRHLHNCKNEVPQSLPEQRTQNFWCILRLELVSAARYFCYATRDFLVATRAYLDDIEDELRKHEVAPHFRRQIKGTIDMLRPLASHHHCYDFIELRDIRRASELYRELIQLIAEAMADHQRIRNGS